MFPQKNLARKGLKESNRHFNKIKNLPNEEFKEWSFRNTTHVSSQCWKIIENQNEYIHVPWNKL